MKRKALMAVCFIALLCNGVFANNIAVSNVKLTGQNAGANTTQVQFDLKWENSWRTSSGPANWDAAWVFVKYRVNGSEWKHASLNNAGHVVPAGSSMDMGLLVPGTGFNATTNPALGAFIYRNANGSGNFSITGVQLQWNYGANGVGDNDLVDVQVFGIEEVYVPSASFYIGSGAGSDPAFEYGSFYKYPTQTDPFQVTSEGQITVGATAGSLYYTGGTLTNNGDVLGPIPPAFPKGFKAFYCMKYEISQQGFVDFLNSLTYAQSHAHYDYYNDIGVSRFAIDTVYGSSAFRSKSPYIACNFLSWSDLAAYLAWAGLRPMTELEYEKACRGVLTPVPHENAWGTPFSAQNYYTVANRDDSTEKITGQLATGFGAGNVIAYNTAGFVINPVPGPYRTGILAASAAGLPNITRAMVGATYYGIMEMSGNVWERTVTLGNTQGRAFTGTHGNGMLDPAGLPVSVADWPSPVSAQGIGQKGGSWRSPITQDSLSVSNRRFAALGTSVRGSQHGGRGVRTAP